mmetsp:Transcript_76477/g.151318  ORF Transcript_76477/g.151318 Transcript_76477/m.151318 type:complete len:409 (+) Transcript_76477:36-1262(+)
MQVPCAAYGAIAPPQVPTTISTRTLHPGALPNCYRLLPQWRQGRSCRRLQSGHFVCGAQQFSAPGYSQLEYRKYLREPRRLTSAQWFKTVYEIPRSDIFLRIRSPVSACTAMAMLACLINCFVGWSCGPLIYAHHLLGSGLSLLLVFRTNSAYQRFCEGRAIWSDILGLCRNISSVLSLYQQEAGPERVRIVRNALQAFPYQMQEHVRSKESAFMERQRKEQWEQRREQLHTEFQKAKLALDVVKRSQRRRERRNRPLTNRPLRIIGRLSKAIRSIPNTDGAFTNAERTWLLTMVNQLSHTVGRCERLIQTPVPLSYSRHTCRFVSVFTLTLPWALVGNLRWLVVPVTALVSWALFGISEIGHVIEDPFRRSLEITPICEVIYADIAEALPLEMEICYGQRLPQKPPP